MCHYPCQIWVLLVNSHATREICLNKINEMHYLDLGGETSSAPNVCSHSSHISRTFQQPAVIFKNFMILENARVEFDDFPGFPGLLLIYPKTILMAILLHCQTKQQTAMSNKHCNLTVILFEQFILFLTLFREENNKIKELSHLFWACHNVLCDKEGIFHRQYTVSQL